MQQSLENEERALLRGKLAQEAQKEEKNAIENKENAHIIARKFALEQEKIRASQIAKLPKPVDQLEAIIATSSKPVKIVSLHDADAFMTTRYHMPETIVDRACDDNNEMQDDARRDALDEATRLNTLEQDQMRTKQERLEKARLRGKHALEKEILTENYNDILNDLNMLQKADREKRQKELINIPKEIFLPAWQREQNKNELQLDMERQFEKMYEDSNLRKDELPQPVDLRQLDAESQSNLEDADLDLTVLDEGNQLHEVSRRVCIEKSMIETDHQMNNVNVNTLTAVTVPTSSAKSVTDQSLTNATQSQSENTTLNKLLGISQIKQFLLLF